MESRISRNTTKALQGVAVIMMVIHHCFLYLNALSCVPLEVCELFGWYGKLCVSIFLICSGIGLYYKQESQEKKELGHYCFRKAVVFYKKYIIFLIVSIICLTLFFGYSFSVRNFALLFSTLSYDINPPWWFVNTYLCLVLLFPFLSVFLRKKYGVFISLVILLLAYGVNFCCGMIGIDITSSLLGNRIYLLLVNQFSLCVGYEFARQFGKIKALTQNISSYLKVIVILASILIRFFLQHYGFANVLTDTIISLALITSLIGYIENDVLLFFGAHSTNVWLIHYFAIQSVNIITGNNSLLSFCVVIAITLILDFSFSIIENWVYGLGSTVKKAIQKGFKD